MKTNSIRIDMNIECANRKSNEKIEQQAADEIVPRCQVIVNEEVWSGPGPGPGPVPVESSDEVEGVKEREQWNNKIEYMLSVIGYVVDLGNCIRFPYVTYKNGGGAFLIPYFVFLLLIGVPMMYLEMSIGQYFKVGNIKLWGKVNIYMKGRTSLH